MATRFAEGGHFGIVSTSGFTANTAVGGRNLGHRRTSISRPRCSVRESGGCHAAGGTARFERARLQIDEFAQSIANIIPIIFSDTKDCFIYAYVNRIQHIFLLVYKDTRKN